MSTGAITVKIVHRHKPAVATTVCLRDRVDTIPMPLSRSSTLGPQISPFGIRTTVVEPGLFRTGVLTQELTASADPSIDDYAERTKQTITTWNGMSGNHGSDPAKLANALVQLASQDQPSLR